MDLEYLIENFDKLIIYFIPASVFMLSYRIFVRYAANTKLLSAETVVLSYVMTSVIRFLYPQASILVILVIAFAAGIAFACLKNTECVEKFFKKRLNKIYWDNIWYGITDYKHGCYLHVFLEGADISYRGAFRDDYKDDAGHTWIVLSNYRMFKGYDEAGEDGTTLKILEDFREDDTKRVAIDTSKILRFSIRYSEESVKIV